MCSRGMSCCIHVVSVAPTVWTGTVRVPLEKYTRTGVSGGCRVHRTSGTWHRAFLYPAAPYLTLGKHNVSIPRSASRPRNGIACLRRERERERERVLRRFWARHSRLLSLMVYFLISWRMCKRKMEFTTSRTGSWQF